MNRKIALIMALVLMATLFTTLRPTSAQVQTLKVGALIPYRLIQGDQGTGGAEGGLKLAVWDINNASGINIGGTRYNIELILKDENAYPLNPSQAYYNTKDLIEAGCRFIIGGFRTECTWEIIRAIKEHNDVAPDEDDVIYLINGASTDDLCNQTVGVDYKGYKWLFRINPINSTMLFKNVLGYLQGYLIPYVLAPMFGGNVKFACIAEDLEWTLKICWYFVNVGLGPNSTCVGCIRTPSGTENFKPYLDQLKEAGARLVCHFYTLPDAKYLAMQWREGEYPFMLVGIDVFGQASVWPLLTGGKCEYEVFEDFSGTRTPITPLAVKFWDNFVGNFSVWPVYTAWGGYNAMLVIKSALEAAGTLNSTVVIQKLEEEERLVLNGKSKFTSIHDVYSISYGPTWPDGYTRAFMVQWIKRPDGSFVKEVVCPVDQPYSRRVVIPPWIYPLYIYDLNLDGKVDMKDIILAIGAFGATPGDPRWKFGFADVNLDGKVDMKDIILVISKFGSSAPQWPLP
ncbi:MAG: ABC transporter substrate-binding protein [Candidatus Bathyarchaeia archaeon]